MANIFFLLVVVVSLLNIFGFIAPIIAMPVVMVCLITGVVVKINDRNEAEK